ncbi:MAG: tyrosine-type recombinase/integrase [Candidatus Brocadiales bacterium]|nr:tyrosine-type recombinase/integrase [Candidatus Brocadiales bacterium]
MQWTYWVDRYVHNYCVVKGLTYASIKTYEDVLGTFKVFMNDRKLRDSPRVVSISDIFEYLEHLKKERGNGQGTVCKHSGIIRNFYRGLVGLGYLEYYENPMRDFKRVKPAPQKLKDVLSRSEAKRLIRAPEAKTVLGIRDKAIMLLLYRTGIRASECCGLKEKDVDLECYSIKVMGKGQRERIVPLNEETVRFLKRYKKARGQSSSLSPFFKTRLKTGITRKGIYDRIKKYVRLAKIKKKISPHNLRHSFATDMINNKVGIVTLQKILGHRCITSTIKYLRITINDLREAIKKHPANEFKDVLNKYLPDVRLPYQLSRSGFK